MAYIIREQIGTLGNGEEVTEYPFNDGQEAGEFYSAMCDEWARARRAEDVCLTFWYECSDRPGEFVQAFNHLYPADK